MTQAQLQNQLLKLKFFIENDCAYIDFGQQNFKIEGKMTGTSIKRIQSKQDRWRNQ